MLHKLALTLSTAVLLSLAAPAYAEDAPPSDPPLMADREQKGAQMFEQADSDKDGFLTKEEMLKAHEQRIDKVFSDLDQDGNGKVSHDEMKAGREKMREKIKERMKERRESRGDGEGFGRRGRGSDDSGSDDRPRFRREQ